MKKLGVLSAFCTLLLACVSQPQMSNERAMNALNERKYDEVIQSLEPKYQSNPTNKDTAFLLAQAHLGAAGFEALKFAGAVGPIHLGSAISGGCDPYTCVYSKLAEHIEFVTNPHYMRARQILNTAFPVPQQTPEHINLLIAVIEVSYAIARLDQLEKFSADPNLVNNPDPLQDDVFFWMNDNLNNLIQELQRALVRSMHSHGSVKNISLQLQGDLALHVQENQMVCYDNNGTASEAFKVLLSLQNSSRRTQGRAPPMIPCPNSP